MLEPLYTADEMRAAEAGHDVQAMMERAGRGVAEAVLRRFPGARRIACVCGRGANGGDGRIAARVLREAGRDAIEELAGPADLVVDALFGTGFRGEPRPEAAALIERMNGAGVPVVSVDVHAGEVVAADIGLEHGETEHRLVTERILEQVPRRAEGDNKYSAGAVLVVGGAPGLTGAACLAAEAAFHADAGYVAVAVPG